jgi:hypothetical protein
MPVLIRLTAILLPGNRVRATLAPTDIPMMRLIKVALPDTLMERRVIREEKRRAVFVHAEGFDDGLGLLGDHEVRKSLCRRDVHLGPFLRVHFHDMINVEEHGIPFNQNAQLQGFCQGQIGPAIGKRVAFLFGCHVQGLAHAKAGLLIPLLAVVLHPCHFPDTLFLCMSPGVVSPR